MRSIKILSAVILLFMTISCAGGEYSTEYENGLVIIPDIKARLTWHTIMDILMQK